MPRSKAPGIVIGRSGGSFGQVHFSGLDFWPRNTSLYVTDFKGNDPYFAYHLLKWLNFDSYNSGSAQPSLNRNFIYPIKIRVPKPKEQTQIAEILSALDAKIALNHRINGELEGMARCCMTTGSCSMISRCAPPKPPPSASPASPANPTAVPAAP